MASATPCESCDNTGEGLFKTVKDCFLTPVSVDPSKIVFECLTHLSPEEVFEFVKALLDSNAHGYPNDRDTTDMIDHVNCSHIGNLRTFTQIFNYMFDKTPMYTEDWLRRKGHNLREFLMKDATEPVRIAPHIALTRCVSKEAIEFLHTLSEEQMHLVLFSAGILSEYCFAEGTLSDNIKKILQQFRR